MKHSFPAIILRAFVLAVTCGLLGTGCGGGGGSELVTGTSGVSLRAKTGVTVPADCQQWLVTFLDAFNAKDGIRILELTGPKDVVDQMTKAPEAARKTMVDSAVSNVQRIADALGSLKSCTVESCQVTPVPKEARSAGAMGAETLIDIRGEVKGSKHTAKASFKLFRKADSADPMSGVWNFSWSPL